MIEKKSPLAATVPAVRDLRKVSGFNPLNLLRSTVSPNGEKVLKLDLRYKRLWFRLACPNGRMVLNPLRITDQMAVFEASLYADKKDTVPLASFTSTQWANGASDKQYVQTAQDAALNEVLDNAGFGIQLCDIAQVSDGSGFGSEIPLSQVKAIKQDTAPVENPAAEMPKQDAAPVENSTLVQKKVEESADDTETPSVIQKTEPPLQNDILAADPPQEQPGKDAFIETEPDVAEEMPPASETQCSYTEDMSVEEICERMTLEEAKSIVVPMGICKGWTLGQVYDERRSSLKWYMAGCQDASNILKAGATLLLKTPQMQKVI